MYFQVFDPEGVGTVALDDMRQQLSGLEVDLSPEDVKVLEDNAKDGKVDLEGS